MNFEETLAAWNKDALSPHGDQILQVILQQHDKRILSLIAVVRKQREALELYARNRKVEFGTSIEKISGILDAREDYGNKAREALTEAERILKG